MSVMTYIPGGDRLQSQVGAPISPQLILRNIAPLKDLKELSNINMRQLGDHYKSPAIGTSSLIEKWEHSHMLRAFSGLRALGLFQQAWTQLQTDGYHLRDITIMAEILN
jgi:hypothetical protein